MNRTRLLYRAIFGVSLLAFGIAFVVAVVGGDLRWAVAAVAVGLGGALASSHLRLRMTLAGARRHTAALGALHRLSTQALAKPAPAADTSGPALAELAAQVKSLQDGIASLRARAYDAESAAIDAEHAALSVRDAVAKAFEHERGSRRYVLGRIDRLSSLVEQLPSAAGEYASLRSLLADPALPMPQLGGWALTSRVVDAVAREVLGVDHPATVVELGSGGSSTWIGLALRANPNGGRAFSLDHLPQYAEGTRRSLLAHGLQDTVQVLDAPLQPVRLGDEEFDWYSLDVLPDSLPPVDVLLVDGPPTVDNPMTRYPAMPLLRDRLAPGAAVILDDTVRKEEQQIVDRWLAENPGLTREADLGKAVLLRWNPLR